VSAFDELERQLAESVADRGRARRAAAIGGLGRWWRGRVGPAALALVVALGLIVATVDRSPARPRGSSTEGRLTAGVSEASCPPCRAVGGRLHGPLRTEGPAAVGQARSPAREVLVRRGIPTVLWASETARLR
jgi:hypothetical protein